jgi:hypothetical protein
MILAAAQELESQKLKKCVYEEILMHIPSLHDRSILCVIPSSTRMHFHTFQLYNLQECAYEEIIMPNTSSHDCQPTSGDNFVEAEAEMNLKIQLQ